MNVEEKIENKNHNMDYEQLEELKNSNLPIVVWGMGDLANNVIGMLIDNGIKPKYVYTNIKTGNEKEIEGIVIVNSLELGDEGCKYNLVMGHSRYELADEIKGNKSINKVYMFSNPFSSHDTSTSFEFVNDNIARYQKIADIVEDDLSRDNLISYINSRCNGCVDYIRNYDNNYFTNSVFKVSDEESYADIGAYDGDTIRLFLAETRGEYKNIYAFEPEPVAYNKLKVYLEANSVTSELYEKGCYSRETVLTFDNTIDTSSHIVEEGGISISVDKLDEMLKYKEVTLIKIAQQGPVADIILGARQLLIRQKPKLVVVLGLDVEHLLEVPKIVKQINPNYKVYLRFLGKLPSRLTMFAI